MKLLVAFLAAGAAAAAEQPHFAPVKATPFSGEPVTIGVGSPDVDASKIHPYRAQWTETFATPANQVMVTGTWTDRVEAIEWKGRKALKRTVIVDRPQRDIHSTTTLIVDAATFEPLMTEENKAGQPADLHLEFNGARVTGQRPGDANAVQPVAANVGTKAFDTLGGMTDLFPATLPLRAGFAARFPNFSVTAGSDADASSVTWLTLRVKRQDTVGLPGGRTVKAWLVDSDTPLGFYKVWIADVAPYIVKTIWVGPGGGRSTFDLVSIDSDGEPWDPLESTCRHASLSIL